MEESHLAALGSSLIQLVLRVSALCELCDFDSACDSLCVFERAHLCNGFVNWPQSLSKKRERISGRRYMKVLLTKPKRSFHVHSFPGRQLTPWVWFLA